MRQKGGKSRGEEKKMPKSLGSTAGGIWKPKPFLGTVELEFWEPNSLWHLGIGILGVKFRGIRVLGAKFPFHSHQVFLEEQLWFILVQLETWKNLGMGIA